MTDDITPLSAEERAELEQLRAEKAAREEAEQARRERAELQRLRAERGIQGQATAQEERGRRLMEPGDDLSMPVGQKVVLAVVAIAVIVAVVMILFAPA